jgi:ABC-type transport system substrate-binding protein
LLRIAVFGDVQRYNVWTLFDGTGGDYWTHAARREYWPRLFGLAPRSLAFEPVFAAAPPASFEFDGETYTATVSLREDQRWSDGSPFSAEDVVFTVSTAIGFELSGHWRAHYNPGILVHAEAGDDLTVKFTFRSQPGVADWGYGVLQGPIVNKSFWEGKVAQAGTLLPDDELRRRIQRLVERQAEVRAQLDDYDQRLSAMNNRTREYESLYREADRVRREWNSLVGNLRVAREEYSQQVAAAQAALFDLDDEDEPTLGSWSFERATGNVYANRVDPDASPLPWFDSLEYITFPDQRAGMDALVRNDVDLLLTTDGLAPDLASLLREDQDVTVSVAPTSSARFMAFNQRNPFLAQKSLRQAIACLLDPGAMSAELAGTAMGLDSFVLNDFWRNPEARLPCAGDEAGARREAARTLLSGMNIAPLVLLAPAAHIDPVRAGMAGWIARVLNENGIPVELQLTDMDTVLYAVYGKGDYDMSMLGWRLSRFPGYLCDWGSEGNPFGYRGSRLVSVCETLESEPDLEKARGLFWDAQVVLTEEVPLIPLYVEIRYDAWRNLVFPFEGILDGPGGLYGAPDFVIPR